MMAVIIDNGNAADFALELKPAARIFEYCKCLRDLRERNIELEGNCRRGQGIVDIMLTGHWKLDLTKDLAPTPYGERGAERIVVAYIVRRYVRLCGHSVRNAPALDAGNDQLHIRIV